MSMLSLNLSYGQEGTDDIGDILKVELNDAEILAQNYLEPLIIGFPMVGTTLPSHTDSGASILP